MTWSNPAVATNKIDCSCCICGEWIRTGQLIVDHEVYKCGELQYIEIAHRSCAANRTLEEGGA